ncbi:hypothetical protein D3C85_1377010 [compost metagenome]
MVGAGSSMAWPTLAPNWRSMNAVTSPWWVPPALMVCNGSPASRASQLPRRCTRFAVTNCCWLPVLVTVVIGSSMLLASVVLKPPFIWAMNTVEMPIACAAPAGRW